MVTPTPNAFCLSQRLITRRNQNRLVYMILVSAAVFLTDLPVLGQQKLAGPRIQFTEKPVHEVQDVIKLAFKIVGASDKRVRIVLSGQADHVVSKEISLSAGDEHVVSVNLFEGSNRITFIVFVNDEPREIKDQPIDVTCTGRWCKKPFGLSTEVVASEVGRSSSPPKEDKSGQNQTKTEQSPDDEKAPKTNTQGNVSIKSPSPGGTVNDGLVRIRVEKKSGIKKLTVAVDDEHGSRVDYQTDLAVTDWDDESSIATATLKMRLGKNRITVSAADKPLDKANFDIAEVTCAGEKCEKPDAAPAKAAKLEQKGRIKITSDKAITWGDKREVKITVKVEKKAGEEPSDKIVVIEVKNKKKLVDQGDPQTIPAAKWDKDVALPVKIQEGLNEVTVYEKDKKDDEHDYAEIKCVGNCATADSSLITINTPEPGFTFPTSFYVASLTVEKAKEKQIDKIKYYVLHDDVQVVNPKDVEAVDVVYEGNEGKATVPIKFVEGDNWITFFDADPKHPKDENRQAKILVKCAGPNCATDFLVSNIPTNSMNSRAVVGMEQVGASSASSETKPFLDFFFTGPIFFNYIKKKIPNGEAGTNGNGATPPLPDVCKKYVCGLDGKPIRVPRFGTWGQIRFSTTPQQTASASVFPSNFVNQVTDPTKVVDLVQSFDYMGGVEFRAFSANGWNWTLIPGVRTKSRLFLTFGAGAISPLNASRTSAQIFRIPSDEVPANPPNPLVPASPQRALFVERFGVPPAGKTYVGFVPLERDRFFRQYYFGIRVKTHYCDDDDCTRFKNSFPAIVDFGVGQNEAVTGGELKQNGKRAWVLRVDAFYPLPFREANFLYLYGTALMKVGQGGVRIDNPLFLDTAPGDVQITSTDVFIPPPGQQPSRLNRDYYKIGIGVNLSDLFNRNKTRPN